MNSARSLIVRQVEPFNAETPLDLDMDPITPVPEFYVRSHFPVPPAPHGFVVDGAVTRSRRWTVADVRQLPVASIITTMECAGNGRAYLEPPTGGVTWHLGAVATAEWRGARLRDVLEEAQIDPAAVEVVFAGADRGIPSGAEEEIAYERSLTVAEALHGPVLLAYEMNGAPLTAQHGAPVRLIVPGWYGMASVKWLNRVTAIKRPFDGHYQVRDYVVRIGDQVRPCREMAVRAVILSPEAGSLHDSGSQIVVGGICWSGRGAVAAVEVSADDGKSWTEATLEPAPSPQVWQRWSLDWKPERLGAYCLIARARDSAGEIQPLEQIWNPGGYSNNAVVPVEITIRQSQP